MNGSLELSGAQRSVWERRELWTDRLHAKWRTVLSRADCEEVVVDAILASALLRRSERADGDVVRQWWALDVKSVAVRRDARLRGGVRVDGTRRGHFASLEAVKDDDGAPVAARIRADPALEPAELLTEGEDGQSRCFRREQAKRICERAIADLKPKYQEILRLHLQSGAAPQRVLCQRLGLTEKAYQARLLVAKEQFARRVRLQSCGATCDEVRVLLGGSLGEHVPRVEAHLEDCYACRAWQLVHRPRAVAAVLPTVAMTRWNSLTERASALVWRTSPVGEVAAAHGESVLGGGLATGLIAGCTAKAAAVACTVALTGLFAAGPGQRTHRDKDRPAAAATTARHPPARHVDAPTQAPAAVASAGRRAPSAARLPPRPERPGRPRASVAPQPRQTSGPSTAAAATAATEFATEQSPAPAAATPAPSEPHPSVSGSVPAQREFSVETGP